VDDMRRFAAYRPPWGRHNSAHIGLVTRPDHGLSVSGPPPTKPRSRGPCWHTPEVVRRALVVQRRSASCVSVAAVSERAMLSPTVAIHRM